GGLLQVAEQASYVDHAGSHKGDVARCRNEAGEKQIATKEFSISPARPMVRARYDECAESRLCRHVRNRKSCKDSDRAKLRAHLDGARNVACFPASGDVSNNYRQASLYGAAKSRIMLSQ